jgi:membrane-associated phospholipid phosphatase
MLTSLKDLLSRFDMYLFEHIKAFTSDANTHIMVFFSFLASQYFLIAANALLGLYFLVLRKDKWSCIRVVAISLSSYCVMSLLKLYFHRARPMHPVHNAASGYSFPSGHALSAMTFYGVLIYLVARHIRNRTVKWVLTILLAGMILLIGLSRVYLRVHYGTDVLAGYCFGFIWLMISLWGLNKLEHRQAHEKMV